jgi:acyl dehydratase
MSNWTGIFAGTTIALLEQNIQYKAAVKFGDTVHLEMKVIEKRETSKPDRGIVKFAAQMINQDGVLVVDMIWTLMMRRRAE